MSNFNFGEGDKVYCPIATNKIVQMTHALAIRYQNAKGKDGIHWFHSDGKWDVCHHNPAIFPATQEWYDKLVHVYPNLEKPPKRKEPIEIILAMVNDWHYTPCRVGDHKDELDYTDLITSIVYSDTPSFIGSSEWKYAQPFDPKTGKNIIDYVDGKIVLEE